MLRDRTNSAGATDGSDRDPQQHQPLKTFRRQKKPEPQPEELSSSGPEQSSRYEVLVQHSGAATAASSRARPKARPDGDGWVTNGLVDRRSSSIILPFPSLLAAANYLAKRRGGQKQRQQQLEDCIVELTAYFAEVDSYELQVESASPLPAPARGARLPSGTAHARQGPCCEEGLAGLEQVAAKLAGLGLSGKHRGAASNKHAAAAPALERSGRTSAVPHDGTCMGSRGDISASARPRTGFVASPEAPFAAATANEVVVVSPSPHRTGVQTSPAGTAAECTTSAADGGLTPDLSPACRRAQGAELPPAPSSGQHVGGSVGDGQAAPAPEGPHSSSSITSTEPEPASATSAITRAAAAAAATDVQGGDACSLAASSDAENGGASEALDLPGQPCLQASPAAEQLTAMQRLLRLCGQELDTAALPNMDQLLRQHADLKRIVKVGEGSYGEAFRHGACVFKVVPIDGEQDFNGGPQKRAEEMLVETLMSLELSKLSGKGAPERPNRTDGFVAAHLVAVCKGPYSRDLVRAWKKWDTQHGSENEPVDSLPPAQAYWIIGMADSGRDLEKYQLSGFDQARSILLQVAVALAVAEKELAFEHRDLHWGNILVRPVDAAAQISARLQGQALRAATHGVQATIIDFTQSRLNAQDGTLAFCDMSKDPAVFEGPKGNVQFDTYRFMRKLVGDDWAASNPQTNCLWMSYLAEVLAQGTTVSLSVAQKRQLRDFRKRSIQYASCSQLMADELFRELLKVAA